MSRVFEALTRANEEKNELDGTQWQLDERIALEKSNGLLKIDPRPQAITLPEPQPVAKSWRERFEELLLGWDLKRYRTHPLVALDSRSAVAEQYKILREHVKTLLVQTGARSIAVTSPVKGDGKTSVTANLAAAIALDSERQVLLIDADLRSPDINRYFGVSARPGLADYLRSRAKENLSDYIQTSFLPNLQIIPAGRPEALSSELLARSKTRDFMDEIFSMFPGHHVIIDAPPILSTSDPLVLANTVDIIIMAVRAGKTSRKNLLEAIETLNSSKLQGIVLSGTQGASSYAYYS